MMYHSRWMEVPKLLDLVLPVALACAVAPALPALAAEVSAPTRTSADSPFGIHDPGFPTAENDITAIGAKWVRYAGRDGIVWDAVERQEGRLDWRHNDHLYLKTRRMGVRMLVSTISASRAHRARHGRTPPNMKAYLDFLRKAVERYDGDGVDDAPGSPVVEIWQIENEPDIFWKDSPQDYARLLMGSYKAVKDANPAAKVAIGGVGTPDGFDGRKEFYIRTLEALDAARAAPGDRYFDVFDLHWYPFAYDYDHMIEPPEPLPEGRLFRLAGYVDDIRQTLARFGYPDTPIFMTETAQYSGTPSRTRMLPPEAADTSSAYHSESRQAVFLVKLYLYAIAHGIQKVFWVTLTEWHAFGGDLNGVFDNVGLINNPLNDGQRHRKLSYYAYKKLAATLEGSDWSTVQTVLDKDGTHVYKLMRNGKPVWVCWNDGRERTTVDLPLGKPGESGEIRITELVPRQGSGKDVSDDATAFRRIVGRSPANPSTRTVTFEIADRPVAVTEESPATPSWMP